jgi:hypothetical protein
MPEYCPVVVSPAVEVCQLCGDVTNDGEKGMMLSKALVILFVLRKVTCFTALHILCFFPGDT